jgi:hypothetical protein
MLCSVYVLWVRGDVQESDDTSIQSDLSDGFRLQSRIAHGRSEHGLTALRQYVYKALASQRFSLHPPILTSLYIPAFHLVNRRIIMTLSTKPL